MKKTLIILSLISFSAISQNKYITKTGEVTFEASVPSFEEVKATNHAVTAIINADNGEFAALVLVKGFRFKNALMEEHFNENYAESDKYPKATFKGNIKDFYLDKLNSLSTFRTDGILTFQGKTKELEGIVFTMSMDKELIVISGSFKANPSDYDIKIPNVVRSKIAETINVSFSFRLKKQ